MAKNINTIKIARGNRTKKAAVYGELFWDQHSNGLYIGNDNKEWIRLGGNENLILKGEVAVLPSADVEVGDTYVITEEGVAGEIGTAINGSVKPGDLVICIGADDAGNPRWYDLDAGTVEAKDVKYDNSDAETAGETSTNVQAALTELYNNKAQYAGKSWTELAGEGVTTLAMNKGTFTVYDGATGDITVQWNDGSEKGASTTFTDVHKGSYVYVDEAGPHIVAGGVSDAENLDFTFKKSRYNTADNLYGFDDVAENVDGAVSTVQEALDDLIATKADLLANGKIPISQIPSTLVGALQFKGVAEIGADGGIEDNAAYTPAEFIEKIANLVGWEKDTDSSKLDEAIDNGDYVIISGSGSFKIGTTVYNSGDWAIWNEDHFDRLNASGAVDNVNGLTGAIEIEGSTRIVNTHETEVVTVTPDAETGKIKIDIPNAAIIPEEGLEDYEIPVGTANNGIVGSGIKLTPTELNNGNVSLRLPQDSGDMPVADPDAEGNFIPKFDPDSNGKKLIDSNLKDDGEKVDIAETFEIDYTNKKIGVYDDEVEGYEYYKFDGHENHRPQPSGEVTHPLTLLDDASVIDGGVWE